MKFLVESFVLELNYYNSRGENPVGNWTIRVKDQKDPNHSGEFLSWSLALWGSAIDPSKVKKFVEPVVDNALPPEDDPDRPVIDDPDLTATTQHSKPTDCLPNDHGHAPGDNTTPAFPGDDCEGTPIDWVTGLVNSHKWFFAALGAVSVLGIGTVIYLWRRKLAKQRQRAAYTSLAEDDIQMDSVGRRRMAGDVETTALFDGDRASTDELPPRQQNVQPPTGRALGFHSAFLDDDEPSAGLTPKYRDEPDEGETHSDDAVIVQQTSDEGSRLGNSREGSREHLP